MPKNIVLLSDGTGNSAGSLFKTNVWRLYQILDLSDPERQVAFYDDGVGTSSFKLFAMLGSIFGFGLKRNVIAIYSFCCRNYQPGDRIYCFGFSRGSFTIRMVVGLIASQGLVDYNDNEADLAASPPTLIGATGGVSTAASSNILETSVSICAGCVMPRSVGGERGAVSRSRRRRRWMSRASSSSESGTRWTPMAARSRK
jgi:hypothetical protein